MPATLCGRFNLCCDSGLRQRGRAFTKSPREAPAAEAGVSMRRSLFGAGVGPTPAMPVRVAIRTLQEDTVLGIDPIDPAHPKRA